MKVVTTAILQAKGIVPLPPPDIEAPSSSESPAPSKRPPKRTPTERWVKTEAEAEDPEERIRKRRRELMVRYTRTWFCAWQELIEFMVQ